MRFEDSLKNWFYTNDSQAAADTARIALLNPDGTPKGSDTIANVLSHLNDTAKIGFGFGTCNTDITVTAKTVAISGFTLQKYGVVCVNFTKAINVAGATLNVNSTGAKPIMINGQALQPGVVRPGMLVQFQYDGTNWNIVGLMGLEQSQSSSDLFVDLGLPSGLRWATRNIDVSQANGFAANIYQYECSFFSWGNVDGHNPTSTSSFAYDWGSNNDGVYAHTDGAKLTANMSASQDAARTNLGSPWRMPTKEEFGELFQYCTYIDSTGNEIPSSTTNKLTTVSGISGILLRSTNNSNTIFFPCSGFGNGTSWSYRGSYGDYWSSSWASATTAHSLYFNSGGVYPQYTYYRFLGRAVRAVQ